MSLAGVAGAEPDRHPPSRFVVGFHEWSPRLGIAASIFEAPVVARDPVLGFVVVEPSDPAAFLDLAVADERVRVVDPDPRMSLVTSLAVGRPALDPFWADQGQYGLRQTRIDQAWWTTFGSPDRLVCIVDTGIRAGHEDLPAERILNDTNLVEGDNDSADGHGHGTHVTGTIGATTNNLRGVAGAAQAGLLVARALDDQGTGTWSHVARAIRWCADEGAHVINLSIGGSEDATVLQDAVEYAADRGTLLVAAAGNGLCDDCILFPAAYPEVIAVGCTDRSEDRCWTSRGGNELDLVAPGDRILSTGHAAADAYTVSSGTSMATPHVSGAAALIWSAVPHLDAAAVRDLLVCTARDAGAPGHDTAFGHGILDAAAAMDAALGAGCSPD